MKRHEKIHQTVRIESIEFGKQNYNVSEYFTFKYGKHEKNMTWHDYPINYRLL